MAAVMTSFQSQHNVYLVQDEVVALQQNARVAMDMLVRDIRSAGYNPNNLVGAGITTAEGQTLEFSRDDGTGTLETIRYTLYNAYGGTVSALGRASPVTSSNQPVATNITQLEFRYLDDDGAPTAVLGDIRSVQVSLLAQAAVPDNRTQSSVKTYTTPSGAVWTSTAGFRSVYLTTTVYCRNMGL